MESPVSVEECRRHGRGSSTNPTASPFCECHLSLRRHWLTQGIWPGPESCKELIEVIQSIEADRYRPACEKSDYSGHGCTCNVCYDSLIRDFPVLHASALGCTFELANMIFGLFSYLPTQRLGF